MDNEKECGAENISLSPISPLVNAESIEERSEGVESYANGDSAVLTRENEESLPSPRQSDADFDLKDGLVSPLDQGCALPSLLDEQQESAPTEDASEKGGLISRKYAAYIAPVDMEPESEGMKEMRHREDPVEVGEESTVKASAEVQHGMNEEPSVEAQSIALDCLETKQAQQAFAHPEQGSHEDPELSQGDVFGRDVEEQLVCDAAGTFSMMDISQGAGNVPQQGTPELLEKDIVVSEERTEEQIQDHSASEELVEQVALDIPNGGVSEEAPAPDAFIKEPSLSTPAMEALIDAVDEEPSHDAGDKEPSLSTPAMEALIDAGHEEPSCEEECFGNVENTEQHLEANEMREGEHSACGDRQDAFEEGIANQLEVDNNQQGRAENNAFTDNDSPLAVTKSADKVLTPVGQELGMDMPFADEKDGKGELGNEQPLAFEQETEQMPSHEASDMEYQAKPYTDDAAHACIADQENPQAFYNEQSQEASLSIVAPEPTDRVLENVGEDMECMKGRGTLARRTNWWGCCGMLDLLLHKD